MIKQFVWKLMGEQGQQAYKKLQLNCSLRYKRLNNRVADKSLVLLLDTPTHGNLGDHAIVLAERQFVLSKCQEIEIVEFTYDECKYCLDDIEKKSFAEKDIILLPGGGFIGSLWPNEQENIIKILNKFKEYKIVIFPQTLYFSSDDEGKQLKEEFLNKLKDCKDITLFVRDAASYEWLKRNVKSDWENVKCSLVPDIVTSLSYKENVIRKKQVLLCFRKDLEKVSDLNFMEVRRVIDRMGYSIEETDTVLQNDIDINDRELVVQRKLDEFAHSSLVITDRLHGMIFSAITGTPCIALDNLSKKVSGGYQWFKELPYIKLVENRPVMIEDIQEMLSVQDTNYDIHNYDEYYELIGKVIRGEM